MCVCVCECVRPSVRAPAACVCAHARARERDASNPRSPSSSSAPSLQLLGTGTKARKRKAGKQRVFSHLCMPSDGALGDCAFAQRSSRLDPRDTLERGDPRKKGRGWGNTHTLPHNRLPSSCPHLYHRYHAPHPHLLLVQRISQQEAPLGRTKRAAP